MKVEALNPLGQFLEVACQHAEARPGATGIVDVGLDDRTHGVDAQAATHLFSGPVGIVLVYTVGKAQVLLNGVKGDVRTARDVGIDGVLGIGGTIGVGAALELIVGKQHLVHRAGSGLDAVFPEDVKRAPQRVGLERHDDIHTRALGNTGNQLDVLAQLFLIHDIIGRLVLFHVI